MTTKTLHHAIAGLVVLATATVTHAVAQSAAVGPVVKPAAVAKKSDAPVPANAATATSIGRGALSVATGTNGPKDDDSSWVEKFDLDGNGGIDETTFVWDNEDKVLYAYSDGTFTCKNGETAMGAMLIGVNAAGNARKRPAHSGFWVVELDEGECGARTAGLMGCKFDATGQTTACGSVTIDAKNDTIIVATTAATP